MAQEQPIHFLRAFARDYSFFPPTESISYYKSSRSRSRLSPCSPCLRGVSCFFILRTSASSADPFCRLTLERVRASTHPTVADRVASYSAHPTDAVGGLFSSFILHPCPASDTSSARRRGSEHGTRSVSRSGRRNTTAVRRRNEPKSRGRVAIRPVAAEAHPAGC